MAQYTFTCCDCKQPVVKYNRRSCSDDKYRCAPCNNTRNDRIKAKRRQENTDFKSYLLQRAFGISIEDFQDMLKEQDGLCAICGFKLMLDKSTCVDHNHSTNRVRGILCMACNTGLGKFGDSVETLIKAAEYLIRTNK